MKAHRTCFVALLLSLLTGGSVHAAKTVADGPYPPSPVIADVALDWSTHQRHAQGSDNFQLTWADDDHQYGAWGDGGGFGGTNSDGRVGLGFARIEGDWNDYRGFNVWGGKDPENPARFNGKSWGTICVDGVLYSWIVPDVPDTGGPRDHYHYIELARSTDHGATWIKAPWRWWREDNLLIPTFLVYGKDNAGARDDHVYSYFVRPQDIDVTQSAFGLKVHKPGVLFLARVHRSRIFDGRDAYEWFTGIDGRRPTWGLLSEKKPVFQNPDGTGWCVSASYNPGLRRYLLATEHGISHAGVMSLFDAPEPWGPWTTVKYWTTSDRFGGSRPGSNLDWADNVFFFSFAPKWFSADGRDFTLVFTGGGNGKNNDSMNTVRGAFSVKGPADGPPYFSDRRGKAVYPRLSRDVELYRWVDFPIEAPGAAGGVAKWDVEGSCLWTHESSDARRTSLLWYSGSGDTYVYRFGGALPGRWRGVTRSPVAALDGLELTVEVTPSGNPSRIGWSGQMSDEPTAWAHQKGPDGELVKCTPILIMMPDVHRWHDDPAGMRAFVAEFNDHHGFNGGHIATIGRSWFEIGSTGSLRNASATPDVRTFAALEAAASEWSQRGGWLHLWMWGKGGSGDFSNLPGGYNGDASRRINRYIAARLGPVPGWSMGVGWDVEFWADETKLQWWLDDLVPELGGWHHWIGLRYSDSNIGKGHDPEPANKGEYLARGITWNTLRSGREQYAGWEHWSTMTSDSAIDAGLAAVPDRPMMSEDRFRQRQSNWPQKDLRSDDDILREIPRWATRGVAAIYGRLLDGSEGSDIWPNKAAIKAVIDRINE